MKIKNTKVYGLKESIIRSGYPMQIGEPVIIDGITVSEMNLKHSMIIAKKLASVKAGTGHDNYLKGITVQCDLQYPQYFTPQIQRYHWINIISSQSKIHKLTSINDIAEHCNEYVLSYNIDLVNELILEYNKDQEYPIKIDDFGYCKSTQCDEPMEIEVKSKKELYQYIISNLPMGFMLWMGISTNYLQLKTIYFQRKNHKLEEWRYFCNWIERLPYFKELVL